MVSAAATGDDPGRLIRPFAVQVSSGAPGPVLDMVSMVVATRPPNDRDALRPEREQILTLCARPRSVAEIAARIDLPISVVKLLVSDMVAEGGLRLGASRGAEALADRGLLRAVLDGLRAL